MAPAILWFALVIGFLGLVVATICGMAYFLWMIVSGRWPNTDNQFEEEQKAAKPVIKANLDEVNDPTVWLPEFAKRTNVSVVSTHRSHPLLPGGAYGGQGFRLEVTQKSQEQLDEEKRVYFAAKEKNNV